MELLGSHLPSLPPEMWEIIAKYLEPADRYSFAASYPSIVELLQKRRLLPITWLPARSTDPAVLSGFAVRAGVEASMDVYVVIGHSYWRDRGNKLDIDKLVTGTGRKRSHPTMQIHGILVAPPGAVKWVKGEQVGIPRKAVVGAYDRPWLKQDPIYIARLPFEGTILMKSVGEGDRVAPYQILVENVAETDDDDAPGRALQTIKNKPFYPPPTTHV